MTIPTLDATIGKTPLVQIQRLDRALRDRGNRILAKLEGNNPAGSVKDRPAHSMLRYAEQRGEISPGDTLIEATSGNTGIALAMVAAMRGYRMVLIMPENASAERTATMRAFGAKIVHVTRAEGMEGARDLAMRMEQAGEGKVLNQFANPDNPRAHFEGTGPEIWDATGGEGTHFVSSMGTTGTIMGCSAYFKQQNPAIQIIGVQPEGESSIPGIRRWPEAYLPAIFDPARVDRTMDVAASDAETMTRRLAAEEGIFAGVSSGGAMHVALSLAAELENATIVSIVCDRGDRYLSTGVFGAIE